MVDYAFDPSQYSDDNFAIEAIPAGMYEALITKCEPKETKNKNGYYLECVHKIIDGQYKDSIVIARLNIINPNVQAENIGKTQLSQLCRAIKLVTMTNTDQLLGKPLKIKVKHVEANGEYEASNDIVAWKPIASAVPENTTPPWAQTNPVKDPAQTTPPFGQTTTETQTAPPWAQAPSQPTAPQNVDAAPPWAQAQTNTNTPPWAR